MRKQENKKLTNRIKVATEKAKVSSRLVSLWVDVDYTSVSRWNSNTMQPKEVNLGDIAELLETDNRLLMLAKTRINTGLAQALEKELRRLNSEENVPYVIEQEVEGVKTKVNNPALIKSLKDFADKYKKEHTTRLYPFFFDKPLEQIKKREIKDTHYFICKSDDNKEDFNFLVVSHREKVIKPLARFYTLDDAQDYVDYMESF